MEGPDLLTLAESGMASTPVLFLGGPFKSFFCSPLQEKTSLGGVTDARLFHQAPRFEARTREKPVQIVKPVARKEITEDDDDPAHWTSIATLEQNSQVSMSDTWENIPPRKAVPVGGDTKTGSLCITETDNVESVHLLWTIVGDRLALVSNPENSGSRVELVSEEVISDDLNHLMCGMESSTFVFDETRRSFVFRRVCTVPSITLESFQSFAEKFIRMGNMSRSLSMLVNAESNRKRGQTYQGLISGLKLFLRLYHTTLAQVAQGLRPLDLDFKTQKFERQIRFVANLLLVHTLPDGIPLLVFLCDQSLHVNNDDLHHLSLFIFKSAAQPFFRFLRRWAFQGKLNEDFAEFGLITNQTYLMMKDRRFWTHAFTHAQLSDSFGFVEKLLPMIATCGKTIQFLRRVDPVSCRIVNFSPEILSHQIELIMSPDQENLIKKKYITFYTDFKNICKTEEKAATAKTSSHKIDVSENDLFENDLSDHDSSESSIVEETTSSPDRNEMSNSYPIDFQLFEQNLTDVLTRVRKEREPVDERPRPCFTPLVILMEKSVLLPLRSQYHVVNEKGVHYLLHDANLLGHLQALRRYLFFGDGEFSRSLCGSLFREMETRPDMKWGPGLLVSVVDSAIASSPFASKDPLAKNVSFYVDENLGRTVRDSSLKLSYKADWPVNIVLTEEVLASYGNVFQFLLRIYRCTWGLQRVFMKLKNHNHGDPEAMEDMKNLHLIRHEMAHFVVLLDSYVKSIIIEQSWLILTDEFSNHCKSIDSIYDSHINYINRICFRCFLNKKAEPVKNLICDVLKMVSSFCEIVVNCESMNKSSLANVKTIFKRFKECEGFLSSVLWKLTNRGYQQHLQDFLLQLNCKNS